MKYTKPSITLVDQAHHIVLTAKGVCGGSKEFDPTDCPGQLMSDGAYSIDE